MAIVGSGPAGLTAAGELAKRGHKVTIFEAFHAAGGVLIYGIPEFRLPKDIVQKEVDRLVADGVEIEPNSIIGKTYTLPELRERFDAVFVAVGAGLPVFMNVPGENLKGVYSANEYLTRVNLMGAYNPDSDTPVLRGQRVAVVGGGNVAMDSVRTARRLGAAESVCVYRRSRTELPARVEEVHHAEQEGVRFEFLTAPVEVLGDEKGWVSGLKCVRMELGEPDASGRRRPVEIPGSEFVFPCEMVVVAIGTKSNPLLTATSPGTPRQQVGLHRDRRQPPDLDGRRLRRRRHRPRRGHGHPGDGRRQEGGRRTSTPTCAASSSRSLPHRRRPRGTELRGSGACRWSLRRAV